MYAPTKEFVLVADDPGQRVPVGKIWFSVGGGFVRNPVYETTLPVFNRGIAAGIEKLCFRLSSGNPLETKDLRNGWGGLRNPKVSFADKQYKVAVQKYQAFAPPQCPRGVKIGRKRRKPKDYNL
eukprot:34836-Rhodomonas_salina.2